MVSEIEVFIRTELAKSPQIFTLFKNIWLKMSLFACYIHLQLAQSYAILLP